MAERGPGQQSLRNRAGRSQRSRRPPLFRTPIEASRGDNTPIPARAA